MSEQLLIGCGHSRDRRESLDGAFTRPRGGIVAEIADGITGAIRAAQRRQG